MALRASLGLSGPLGLLYKRQDNASTHTMTDSWGASFPQDSKLPDEKTRQYLTAGAPVFFEALRAPVSQPAPQPASQPHDRLVLSTLCLSGPLWASLCVYICASPRHFGLLWASLGLWLQITTAYFRGTSHEQARCNLHRRTHTYVYTLMFEHTQRLFSSAPVMYTKAWSQQCRCANIHLVL